MTLIIELDGYRIDEKALLEKTTLEFDRVPLRDVAKSIDERLPGVNVLLDHKALG